MKNVVKPFDHNLSNVRFKHSIHSVLNICILVVCICLGIFIGHKVAIVFHSLAMAYDIFIGKNRRISSMLQYYL